MDKVRLYLKEIVEVSSNTDIGLLILVDEQEKRQLVIPCDKLMKYELNARVQKKNCSRRLPEVLLNLLRNNTDLSFEILLTDIIDGDFKAQLFNLDSLEMIPINAADAILISKIAHLPLSASERLMFRQSAKYTPGVVSVSLPINILTNEMLQEAMNKAISEERYEQASQIRDELKRRVEGK